MDDKSYVSLEQHVCPVCGVAFETGSLLFDMRLHPSMTRYTKTGWSLCVEHRRLFDAGFVALVECDPQRSGLTADSTSVTPEQVHRTGRCAHIKRELFPKVFDVSLAADQDCVFVEPGVIDRLQAMVSSST